MKRVLMVASAMVVLAAGGCSSAVATETATGVDPVGGVQVDKKIHDSLPESIRARGSVRLMTDASYAPMEQFAADGRTVIGFSADLASALGSVLGVKVELVQGEFQSSLDEVNKGTYDGVLSSMTDTVEREKKADFVNYFAAGTSIIVQRGNPRNVSDLSDLCGQVVAAESGTTQADLLLRSQKGCGTRRMTIKQYKTNADALVELRTGRAVAVLNDFPPAAYLATDGRTRAFYQLASTAQYEPGLFGIAVAKDNTALRDALKTALDRLIHDGTYTELLQRWSLASGGVGASSINSGR